MPRNLSTLAAAVPGLLLAACAAASAPAGNSHGADFVIVAEDFAYVPERLEIPSGEPLTINLRNDGDIAHDLVFEDGRQSGEVRPGEAVTVQLDPQVASSVAWCSVPGHRGAGMELQVAVYAGGGA